MNHIRRLQTVALALLCIVTLSCAKMGFPPGGPDDETAPTLLESIPASLATNVPRDGGITLNFSERMDIKTVEDNLVIVPIPPRWPVFNWKDGDTVLKLDFPDPFLENTTYVLSLGSNVSDLRRNDMGETVNISFSTGEKLQNGKIRGKVIPGTFIIGDLENIRGVDVAAFRLTVDSDAPDPRFDIPDYVTQSGDDGSFELIGISSGNYRLFAIDDKDKNGFFSESYDLLGIVHRDVTLAETDSLAFSTDIALSLRDTSSVQLLSLSAKDQRRVEFYFDRPLDMKNSSIEIDGLDIELTFTPPGKESVVSMITSPMEDGKRYTLGNATVRDHFGNLLMPLQDMPFFPGTADADTTMLSVETVYPAILPPGDSPVKLTFNRPLDSNEDYDAVFIGELPCEIEVSKTTVNELTLTPEGTWPGDTVFSLTFDSGKLRAFAGNNLREDGPHFEFRVVSQDTLGYISGSIDDHSSQAETPYCLEFVNVDMGTHFVLNVDGAVAWETGAVLPGRYLLRALRDMNENGRYDSGMLKPFTRPEQIAAYADTIVVASRWTNSDNSVIFR